MDDSIAKERMTKYLGGLHEGAYERAAEQFTGDVVYHHPLLDNPIEGREHLVEFWKRRESKEGATDTIHELQRWVIDGENFAFLAHMSGPRGATPFLGYGEIRDGKIAFYMPALLHDIW